MRSFRLDLRVDGGADVVGGLVYLSDMTVGLSPGLGLDPRELLPEFFQFFVAEFFEIDQVSSGAFYAADQLVELEVDRFRVAVLGVLDQEDHQESDDGGAGVDDELPRVGEMEDWAGGGPDDDDQYRQEECPFRTDGRRGAGGDLAERLVE